MKPSFSSEFWAYVDKLVRERAVVIDRPRGSAHPRFPAIIYPLDYGYLEGTAAVDGGGIDVWVGEGGVTPPVGLYCTIDLDKRDMEVKLLLGCSEGEIERIGHFMNSHSMRAILLRREA